MSACLRLCECQFHFGVVFVDLSVLHLLVIPSFFSVVRLSLLILLILTL